MVRWSERGRSHGGLVHARLRDRRGRTAHRNALIRRNIDLTANVLGHVMKVIRSLAAALALALISAPLPAADLNCHGPSNLEDFHYSWRMRGGLSWVAGLIF